ncbi:hypothetical protein BBJ28_00019563 [Nothophytophthora sp. Chile5]|nr:hypothetical protein BBJ28_00019563 [Nothophytophthora sp. Chile5]
MPKKWDAQQIPSQKGTLAIVTGANSGLGFETALELSRKGAHVVLACRNETRGRGAEAKIRELLASTMDAGTAEFVQLDVSDLTSVRSFSEQFTKTHDRLDLLINNAGVMGGDYAQTVDGYERQFATNHLGHFALTAQLLPLLQSAPSSRVVNVSSGLSRTVSSFNEKELNASEENYGQVEAYNVSKLCNLLFTMELARRLRTSNVNGVTVVACHPGIADTNLTTSPSASNSSWLWKVLFKLSWLLPHHSAQMGVLPTLYAATGSEVESGDYFGPKYLRSFGTPAREDPPKLSKSTDAATKLWVLSEQLAHLSFEIRS